MWLYSSHECGGVYMNTASSSSAAAKTASQRVGRRSVRIHVAPLNAPQALAIQPVQLLPDAQRLTNGAVVGGRHLGWLHAAELDAADQRVGIVHDATIPSD